MCFVVVVSFSLLVCGYVSVCFSRICNDGSWLLFFYVNVMKLLLLLYGSSVYDELNIDCSCLRCCGNVGLLFMKLIVSMLDVFRCVWYVLRNVLLV